MADKFPGWRYGPNGQADIFNSEAEIPKGWVEHPSLLKGAASAPEGTKTAIAPANSTTTAAQAAKTTTPKSQTQVDPAISAKSGAPPAGPGLDAHGHPFDPALHAATQSKTKDGLWRMKVGVKRPDPAPGYPLDL